VSRLGRFRPPPFEISAPLQWVLVRAFGPSGATAPRPEGQEAFDLAVRFDLAARIATRTPPSQLLAELGVSSARAFGLARAEVLERSHRLRCTRAAVGRIATAAAIPIAWLKFSALDALGVLPEGGRAATDVDILVPKTQAEALQRQLLAAGFRRDGLPGARHQLPRLVSPEGCGVEVHHCLP
jgi:hypothetical protein